MNTPRTRFTVHFIGIVFSFGQNRNPIGRCFPTSNFPKNKARCRLFETFFSKIWHQLNTRSSLAHPWPSFNINLNDRLNILTAMVLKAVCRNRYFSVVLINKILCFWLLAKNKHTRNFYMVAETDENGVSSGSTGEISIRSNRLRRWIAWFTSQGSILCIVVYRMMIKQKFSLPWL